jgi:hypothetical protein
MARVKGNSLLVYVNDVAIGCLNNNEFTSQNEEIDATCKDNDGARNVLPGGNTASISFDGTFDTASTYGWDELIAIHKNKTSVAIRMGVVGSGGSYIQAASAYLNQLSWSGPLNAATVFNGTFSIDGVWTYGNHT